MINNFRYLLKNILQKINCHKGVYIGNGLILTKVFHYKMVLPAKDLSMTPCLLIDGHWEPMITKFFLNLISKGMVVLDIGAAFGYYTLLSADRVGGEGKVIAFEPEPSNFEIIEKNCFLNGFLKRLILVNKAVSDKEGVKKLYYNKDYVLGAASLIGSSQEDTIEVETISVDNFLRASNINSVDVVKIDVEGYEPLVIRGMIETIKNSKQIKIVLEFSPGYYRAINISPTNFLEELKEYGFITIKKIDDFTGRLEEIKTKDLASEDLFMCYLEK